MKIKKLEIHNLASIKDATIDFEKGSLADAELFLITGTTGSGKTTLLDAISLALYNTTPRIAKGQSGKAEANADNLTGRDPRNIMRQNTGYAYSKLWFEGNDGTNYLAEWSVSRGKYCKVNVGLSNAIWSITNLDTGACISEQKEGRKDEGGYKDVEAVITAAIGLDFNQFCRTTMLAQGEFTEFLKSDESAKADILEKISGTGIYRKIGKEIHSQYGKIKTALEQAQNDHENIAILDTDERMALESELAQTLASISTLDSEEKALEESIAWMMSKEEKSQKVEQAANDLKASAAVIESEEFIQRKKTVQQWKETIAVRQDLGSSKTHKANADAAASKLIELEQEFREALAGEAYERGLLEEARKNIANVQDDIKAQERNASIYEQEQTITANIKSWIVEATKGEGYRKELKQQAEVKFPAAEAVLKSAAEALEAATKAEAETKQLLGKVEEELEKQKLPNLRKEKDFLVGIKTIKDTIEKHIGEIVQKKEDITVIENELKALTAQAEKENTELARLEEEHRRRKQTIDNFAKEMRLQLHAGLGKQDNLCPVCGQVVTHLKADELLTQEYEKILNEYNAQAGKAKDASSKVTEATSILKVKRDALSEDEKSLNSAKEKLAGQTNGRPDSQTLADASATDVEGMIAELQKRIEQGEAIEREKNALAQTHLGKVQESGNAQKRYTKAEGDVKAIKTSIEALEKNIKDSDSSVNSWIKSIEDAIGESLPWENSWKTNPNEFIKELKEKASKFNILIQQEKRLQSSIDSIISNLEFVSGIKETIIEKMPDWNTEDVIPKKKADIQTVWSRLSGNIQSALETYHRENESYLRYAEKVRMFIEENTAYSLETLERLMRISIADNTSEEKYVNEKLAGHQTDKATYAACRKDLDQILQSKPEGIKDEDTHASLTAVKDEVKKRSKEALLQKKDIQDKLNADDENIKLKGDTSKLEKLKEEYDNWNSFHSLFGDSEGNKLSKVAQSYVLESLLANANRHLRNMAPRYRLLVNPGTLNLKLEDQYNDYQTRSTNSISGGESFLVSLALALALADFGQHLGVSMLFIDEGFGTLSGEALTCAINTLKSLHTDSGRQVGIISHREEIRDSIPVQIKVNLAPGTSASTVEVSE